MHGFSSGYNFCSIFNFNIMLEEFFKLDTMPLKVLVFVRRLETAITNQVHPDLSPNLGLNVAVQYLGFSGGKIFSPLMIPTIG